MYYLIFMIFLKKKLFFLKKHNVKINNIILDPGIGFGKKFET